MNKDYEETELISTTANYRAVGPTAEAYVSLRRGLVLPVCSGGLSRNWLRFCCAGINPLRRRGDS